MKTAIVTGATGEIGRGIVLRLLETYNQIKIIISARTLEKATLFISTLLVSKEYESLTRNSLSKNKHFLKPWAVDFADLDNFKHNLNKLKSEMYNESIDFLFLNAGIISANGMDYMKAGVQMFTDIRSFFTNPSFIIQTNPISKEHNMPIVFINNVFTSYIMAIFCLKEINKNIKELKIIWSGSTEAISEYFDPQDITCRYGKFPYGSSKYLIQVLSEYLNINYKSVKSFVANPNTVSSPISREICPLFLLPLIFYFSILVKS